MNDIQILELLRNGEHHIALDHLYDGYNPVKSFIIKHGGHEDDVKDVFQEALMIFYQKATSKDFQLTCKISTYLYSVSKLLWKQKIKQNERFTTDFDFDIPVEIEQDFVADAYDNFSFLDTILRKLGDKCQNVLESYYVLKMSMEQIADKLKYSSASSAKNQKYKCLERAKKIARKHNSQINHSKTV